MMMTSNRGLFDLDGNREVISTVIFESRSLDVVVFSFSEGNPVRDS